MISDRSSKNSVNIDVDTVRYVAFLVRLGIAEKEAQEFSQQFSSIIDYFRLLTEVDTENVPPACETSSTHSVMRLDEVHHSMPRGELLDIAPQTNGDFIQVPPIFDEG